MNILPKKTWYNVVLFFFAIIVMLSKCSNNQNSEKDMDKETFPYEVNQITDSVSNLECIMNIKKGSDDAIKGVTIVLRNPTPNQNIMIKVNDDISTFIMLTITDQTGQVLSNQPKKFNTSEIQNFKEITFKPGDSQQWNLPISNYLPLSNVPKEGINHGRLVANVALIFRSIKGNESSKKQFQRSLLTLYNMELLFTQTALNE